MRTLLTLALSLLAPLSAFAASPSFSSFATNDFVVTTNLSGPWVITANRFGVTNSFTNFTIINTNVFISNNYTTNITDNSLVIYTNSTVIYTNTTVTINGTNVATINPTDTLLPYRVDSNTFGDSSLKWLNALSLQGTNLTTKGRLEASGAFVTGLAASYALGAGPNTVTLTNASLVFLASLSSAATVELTTGSAVGARVLLLNSDTNFSLTLTNSALVDDAGQSVTVAGGYWTPTSLGESIQLVYTSTGWFEEGRFNPNVAPPSADDHLVFASGFDEVPGSLITKVNAGLGITTGIEGDTDDHLIVGLEPSMIHWTNSAGTLMTTLTPDGTNAFTIDPNTGWTGTGTNYFGDDGKFHGTAINTNGGNLSGSLSAPFLPYATGTDTLADSPVRREDAWNVRSTNLITEHRLITEGAFITTNLSTATLSTGTNILVLTNKAMLVLAAVDPSGVVVQLTSGNGSGQHVWLVNYYTNATFTLPSGVCFDDTNKVVVIRGGEWTPTETGESIELLGMPQGWIEINRANPNGPAPITGTNYWTNIAGVLQPLDLTLPLYWTNTVTLGVDGSPAIVFGPGDTNVLYRNGPQLVYTNGATSGNGVTFAIRNGNGKVATYGIDQDQHAIVRADAGQLVRIEPNSGSITYTFTTATLAPNGGLTPTLGSDNPSFLWGDFFHTNSDTLYGYYSGTTNYARVVKSHTGTNGVGSGIVWDSQSGGEAGEARDFLWQSNGVTVAKIAANSGYTGSGEKTLSDNGTYQYPFPPYASQATNIYVENMAVGTNTLFTCPAEYNFIVTGASAVTTNQAVSPVLKMYYVTNGVYYAVASPGLSTNNNASTTVSQFVLTNGWSVAFSTLSNGANVFLEGVYVPLDSRRKTYTLEVTSAATNLLYQVPANHRAVSATDVVVAGGPRVFTAQNSGGNITFSLFYVPNGGSLSDNSRVSVRSQGAGTSALAYTTQFVLNAGDAIYATSNSTDPSQLAWVDVLEVAE